MLLLIQALLNNFTNLNLMKRARKNIYPHEDGYNASSICPLQTAFENNSDKIISNMWNGLNLK